MILNITLKLKRLAALKTLLYFSAVLTDWAKFVPDWHQMGQIWYYLRSVWLSQHLLTTVDLKKVIDLLHLVMIKAQSDTLMTAVS